MLTLVAFCYYHNHIWFLWIVSSALILRINSSLEVKGDEIMLVLRRTSGQSIVIGKNAEIVVKILKEDRGIISVGIDAPKAILVDRLEVYKRRQANDALIQNVNAN